MRKAVHLLLVGASILLSASWASADNDCCFDTALPPINGFLQCAPVGPQVPCFNRPGIQIFVPGYNCLALGNNMCVSKDIVTDECWVYKGGKPEGECTIQDLVFESRAVPGMTPYGLVVVAALIAVGAVMVIRRRAATKTA